MNSRDIQGQQILVSLDEVMRVALPQFSIPNKMVLTRMSGTKQGWGAIECGFSL
jgi:hypothetical protein